MGARVITFTATGSHQEAKSRLGIPPESQGAGNLGAWPAGQGAGLGAKLWPGCDGSVCPQVSAVLSTPLWEWFLQRFGKRVSAFGITVSEAGSRARGRVGQG